jgi:hypothetical protein
MSVFQDQHQEDKILCSPQQVMIHVQFLIWKIMQTVHKGTGRNLRKILNISVNILCSNMRTVGCESDEMFSSCLIKVKAITVTGRGGLQVCEMLMIPQCLENLLKDGGTVDIHMHRLCCTPQEHVFCFWYSFLLVAEKTPGPSAAGRIR